MSPTLKILSLAVFLFAVFVAVPVMIVVTGHTDYYYTLTSVALLSIASAGV